MRLPRLRITKGALPRSVRICRPEVLDLRIGNASVPSGSANVSPFLLVATGIVAGHVEREPSLAAQHFASFLISNSLADIRTAYSSTSTLSRWIRSDLRAPTRAATAPLNKHQHGDEHRARRLPLYCALRRRGHATFHRLLWEVVRGVGRPPRVICPVRRSAPQRLRVGQPLRRSRQDEPGAAEEREDSAPGSLGGVAREAFQP